jgi:excisionase family DNA binding protein
MLTVHALSQRLQITPSTRYAWANQGKIPNLKIHGLVRFDPSEIDHWLSSFSLTQSVPPEIGISKRDPADLDRWIASAKREVYTSGHGETITPSPTGKE